jgi:urocanate hydratase
VAAFLRTASGAAWLSVQETTGPNGAERSSSFVVVADGKPETAQAIARLFAAGPADFPF